MIKLIGRMLSMCVIAMAGFVAMDGDLSAKLHLHAMTKPDENSIYEPLYGGRVFSSSQVIDAIDSNSKSNGWRIRISNPTSEALTVSYNSKMCNYDDAKNWSNLSDVKNITLNAGSSTTVTISENWFATSIAISYKSGSKRRITYAKDLNSNGTMTVANNWVNV